MPKLNISKLLLLFVTIYLANCLSNPGILITIPFQTPLQPPQVNLNLPISIDPIIYNALQLSEIQIKSLQYTWSFTQQTATIKISDAAILFAWRYKSDQGLGTFQQSQYQISLDYKFIQNSKNRAQIEIVSTKSKIGHTSVHLGGNVKQIVAVEVTNLIMNHAAIIFRKSIENAISNAVKSFSSILDHDPKVFCSPTQKERCLFTNFTLVAPPIVNSKTLLIQLNGASYIVGEQSGVLNPEKVLVKSGSSKIEAQAHVKVMQQIVQKALKLIPQNFDFDIGSKFDTFDLNSLTISPLFPKMVQFYPPRGFLLRISSLNANSLFNEASQSISSLISAQLNVLTKNPSTHAYESYLSQPCKTDIKLDLKIIYGWKGVSIRISSLNIQSFVCGQNDVQQNRVRPDELIYYKDTFAMLLKTGINGQINSKVNNFEFNGILAVLTGKLISDQAIFDLTLSPSQSNGNQNISGFEVVLL